MHSRKEYAKIAAATPCILYDTANWTSTSNSEQIQANQTTLALVQITPAFCHNHRDGAKIGVDSINQKNSGRGFEVGYTSRNYVQFRLLSLVLGVNADLESEYAYLHEDLMNYLLSNASGYNVKFIVGTYSHKSSYESMAARTYQRLLLAQVGPNVYYEE